MQCGGGRWEWEPAEWERDSVWVRMRGGMADTTKGDGERLGIVQDQYSASSQNLRSRETLMAAPQGSLCGGLPRLVGCPFLLPFLGLTWGAHAPAAPGVLGRGRWAAPPPQPIPGEPGSSSTCRVALLCCNSAQAPLVSSSGLYPYPHPKASVPTPRFRRLRLNSTSPGVGVPGGVACWLPEGQSAVVSVSVSMSESPCTGARLCACPCPCVQPRD